MGCCSQRKPRRKQTPAQRRRGHIITGFIKLLVGAICLLLGTISLPAWKDMEMTRVTFNADANVAGPTVAGFGNATQVRLGLWGYCVWHDGSSKVDCVSQVPYSIPITTPTTPSKTALIKSTWTQGLIVHAVGAALTILAVPLFFILKKERTLLVAALFYGTVLSFVAFVIQIALLVLVKDEMHKLGIGASTIGGTAFFLGIDIVIELPIATAIFWAILRHDRKVAAGELPTPSETLEKGEKGIESKSASTNTSSTTLAVITPPEEKPSWKDRFISKCTDCQ